MKKKPIDNSNRKTGKGGVKQSAVSGAIFILPMVVTLFVMAWLLGFMSLVPGFGALEVTSYFYVNQAIKLFFLTTTSGLLFTGVGQLVDTRYGVKLEEAVDSSVNKIPLVGAVYSTTKTAADTALGGADFGSPVEVDLGGISLTGFKTGNGKRRGKSMVFIPTSPNITSGFLVEIENEWIRSTEETRTEAITRVLSAGFGARFDPEEMTEKRQRKIKN